MTWWMKKAPCARPVPLPLPSSVKPHLVQRHMDSVLTIGLSICLPPPIKLFGRVSLELPLVCLLYHLANSFEVMLGNFFNGRTVEEDAVAEDRGDPRPMHRREQACVPNSFEVRGPSLRRLPREPQRNEVERASPFSVVS